MDTRRGVCAKRRPLARIGSGACGMPNDGGVGYRMWYGREDRDMSEIRSVLLIGGPSDGKHVRHDITNPVLYIHEKASSEKIVSFGGAVPFSSTFINTFLRKTAHLYRRESYRAGSLHLYVYVFQSLSPEEALQKLIENYKPDSRESMPL